MPPPGRCKSVDSPARLRHEPSALVTQRTRTRGWFAGNVSLLIPKTWTGCSIHFRMHRKQERSAMQRNIGSCVAR